MPALPLTEELSLRVFQFREQQFGRFVQEHGGNMERARTAYQSYLMSIPGA